MTDTDRLSAALRDRVRDEHPDLHSLTDASLRAGTRMRRRRTAGIATGVGTGLALVAGSVLLASGLPGGDRDPRPTPEVGFATSPSDVPSVKEPLDKDDAKQQAALEKDREREARQRKQDAPGDDTETTPQAMRVALVLDGWSCEAPADDKFGCASDTGMITVVLRAAADHAAWVNDADKGGSSVWVSPVHDDYFVSVQGDLGDTSVEEFVDGLEFGGSGPR